MEEGRELLDRLPDRSGLERLWGLLPGARLVGGSVRDLLRGCAVQDLDLATPEPPERVQDILRSAGIVVVPTGLQHGTVTAVLDHVPYEITTLRRDEQTDGRHAVVAWTDSWEEDAARRDFTINAMSLDRGGQLYDYFGGRDDLAAGRVRFVGDAGRRIEEDALRALRFYRFEARYGSGVPDQAASGAIGARLELIDLLSAERVASEVLKILSGPRVMETVGAMCDVGILGRILPEAELGFLGQLLACKADVGAMVRLYALCSGRVQDVGARLKLSNADRAWLRDCAAESPVLWPGMTGDDVRRARVEKPLSRLLDRSWLAQAHSGAGPDGEWDALRARLSTEVQPVFPLDGKDALAAGVQPGPDVGAWLSAGRLWWMAEGCLPDRAACLAWMGLLRN